MSEPPRVQIDIRPTDRSWAGEEPYEDPGPCSRCGARLGEDEMPLLLWNAQGRLWRYHFRCIGVADPSPIDADWDDEETPDA
jgi:hypothetical protein